MEESYKLKVGITHGDINGIGYEVILKTLEDNRMVESCTPVLYGSLKVAAYHRKMLDLPSINFNSIESGNSARPLKNNLVSCIDEESKVEIGTSTQQGGEAALASLQRAIKDIMNNEIDVLVTAPINKLNIQSDTFNFPGHTEYLEDQCGGGKKSLMILLKENLRVALVTGHIPLSEVASSITQDIIVEKLTIFNQSLIEDFNIIKPRIAVLSLNPHAGEKGLLGNEEQEIITPAMKVAEEKGVLSFGPYPADGFFGAGNYKKFDGVLAMYHDQGLAPFKTLAMDEGVNFTAGLPIVRTSPAHGTAYDIAGKNEASEASMRSAIFTAIDIYNNRQQYKERLTNPLRKQYYDKSGDREKLDLDKD